MARMVQLTQRCFAGRRLRFEAGGVIAAEREVSLAPAITRSLPVRLAVHACSQLMTSSSMNENTSITAAIAVAPR